MSELKSVIKLREWLDCKVKKFDFDYGTIVLKRGVNPNDLYYLADEIEREVTERFIELPMDADGIPIHVGDRLWFVDGYPFYVRSIVVKKDKAFVNTNTNHVSFVTYKAEECHHVKPRTVEDVLYEFGRRYNYRYPNTGNLVDETAAELRGMMEADE